jgi:hypothetical protein
MFERLSKENPLVVDAVDFHADNQRRIAISTVT